MDTTKQSFVNYFLYNSWNLTEASLGSLQKMPVRKNQANFLSLVENLQNVAKFALPEQSRAEQLLVGLLSNSKDEQLLLKQINFLAAACDCREQIDDYDTTQLDFFPPYSPYDYDLTQLLKTCRNGIISEDINLARQILGWISFDNAAGRDEYSWEEALLQTMFLRALWAAFPRLSAFPRVTYAEQSQVLINAFWSAIVVGVPVRNILKMVLETSTGVVEYTIIIGSMVLALEKNIEKIFIDKQGNSVVGSDMFRQYMKFAGSKYSTPESIKVFVQQICKDNNLSGNYPMWLTEALSLMVSLKTTKLLTFDEILKKENASDLGRSLADLSKLFEWYFFPEEWGNFVAYYSGKQVPLITLQGFIANCMSKLDLSKQEAVDSLLAFDSFLKEQKLVPSNQDIIVFHQSDNQFHWNEEMLA